MQRVWNWRPNLAVMARCEQRKQEAWKSKRCIRHMIRYLRGDELYRSSTVPIMEFTDWCPNITSVNHFNSVLEWFLHVILHFNVTVSPLLAKFNYLAGSATQSWHSGRERYNERWFSKVGFIVFSHRRCYCHRIHTSGKYSSHGTRYGEDPCFV